MSNNIILRNKKPLVHCMTNYVTVNDVANAILAIGGSPIMADDEGEVEEIAGLANALVINIGTLNRRTIQSMIKAGKAANDKNIPVILDPVGAGVSSLRNEAVKNLWREIKFSVIRGNLSEIAFCAGEKSSTRGVDSGATDDEKFSAAEVSKIAAKTFECVVCVTGAEDIITDGKKFAFIQNGVPEMSKVTGTGCMLSGIIGAYAGANENIFDATIDAVASMGIAGEIAFQHYGEVGTGSLRLGIIDVLSKIDDDILFEAARIRREER